ncbi:Fe(2+) transporter, partial [Cladochytrium tenue]
MSEDDYESLPGSPMHVNMLAGALAGIAEHTVMFPFDSVKSVQTRMQAMTLYKVPIYTSVMSAMRRIASSEGSMALWRGVNSVFIGAGPAHALHFATYEECKILFGNPGLAAAAATVLSEGVMTPFDVAKQRMQLHPGKYSSVRHCFRAIARHEGLRGLYLSYPTTLFMAVPFQALHFSAYERLRTIMNPSGRYDPLAHVVSGAVAGAVAAAATTPLDVVKTVLQTRGVSGDWDVRRVRGFKGAARLVAKRGGGLR